LIEIQEANKIKPLLFYWLGKKIAYVLKAFVFFIYSCFVFISFKQLK